MEWSLWMVIVMVVAATAMVEGGGGSNVARENNNVTYDGRSLIIDGQRKLLFSGSIHYPRSTPQLKLNLHIIRISSGSEDG
ncbi:hypothetical protein CsSME_00002939 [Camellia sinensis var. sinensis]